MRTRVQRQANSESDARKRFDFEIRTSERSALLASAPFEIEPNTRYIPLAVGNKAIKKNNETNSII